MNYFSSYRYIAFKPYVIKIALASICSIINKLCDIVPEILIGLAINIIITQEHSLIALLTGITNPFNQLYLVGLLTAILWILESIFEYLYLILWHHIAQNIQHNLRCSLYEHIQLLDTAYFENKTVGGLASIINNDINELEIFFATLPNALLQLTVNVIVMGFIFTYLSPFLAFLTILPIPFIIIIAYYFKHKLTILYNGLRIQAESLSSHLVNKINGINTIKSYVTENYELDLISQESNSYKAMYTKVNITNAAYIPIVRMAVLCGFITSMIVGGYYALHGIIAISSYSVLVFLTQRFLWPFTEISTITDTFVSAQASLQRVNAILSHTPTIQKSGHSLLTLQHIKGEIVFNNVSFSYASNKPIFNNLSLTIPAHSTIAFVGTTGSGKSTLIKLLLRLYEPTAGAIYIDGTDIASVSLNSLRKSIALVSQDTYLMNGTIEDNIRYGTFHATQDEIIQAAVLAEADSFIKQLPQGYQTHVGENGKNLSGGQRQRISIARAIIKKPAIFIFDEATSALDNETETAVQKSFERLAHQHTTIIIAHRLSTIRKADIIFVMDNGTIIESGNHLQLLAHNQTYAKLWKIQTGIQT